MKTIEQSLQAARLKTARAVLAEVEAELGVPTAAILSTIRRPNVAAARHETMVRLWRQGMSITDIARTLDMHHVSVIAGIRKRIGLAAYKAESAGPGRVTPRSRVA